MGMSAAAIMGASSTPAWADAEPVTMAAFFDSNGALDASSLGDVHTGVAPAPGLGNEEEVRRKRPNSTETDPLMANRSADPRPAKPDLVGFTPRPAAPISQQPAQNPATTAPPPTNNTPVASNPPPANNPPATTTTPSLGASITSTILSTASSLSGGILNTFLRR